jgi:hypothetical protein
VKVVELYWFNRLMSSDPLLYPLLLLLAAQWLDTSADDAVHAAAAVSGAALTRALVAI